MANQINLAPEFVERYPGASAKATEASMNLVLTADMLVKRIGELVQPFDLSPSSGLVLGMLADAGTPMPPKQIAERLIISRASVTSLLDSLERRRYVRRMPHSTDRRMILIELTDAGRQVAHEFRLIVHRHQKDWLAILDSAEQDLLIDALHRLQLALTEPEPLESVL